MANCNCNRKPLCATHEHEENLCENHGHITFSIGLPNGAEGPECIWCNNATKRTGLCFTCTTCGSTTSC